MKNKNWWMLLLFTGIISFANAAYYKFLPYKVSQPDGTEIRCYVSGDEFFNWLHDKDGFTIIQANDGYYYYGSVSGDLVVPSSFLVNTVDPESAGLQKWAKISLKEYNKRKDWYNGYIDKSIKAPHNGTLNNIAIYIRFADDPEFTATRQSFDNKFNPPTGNSMKSYYSEVSYNNFIISSTHYPACAMTTNYSYQDPHNRSYFQPYNATTNPEGYDGSDERRLREHGLLRDAVAWINTNSPVPSDLNIDGDDDGLVDNVCFIIEGTNDAWAELLWAHRWVLFTYNVTINGKQVYDYTFQPESQVDVNTLCHEMYHSLGAPDLYHYSYDGFTTVGDWDIMESGKGSMGAYMKWRYAGTTWIDSIPVIRKSGVYSLRPLSSQTNNCYQIASPNTPWEYFVLEYRQKKGTFEGNIPGTGLLIYRIDPSLNGNASGPPDEVYVFRPGGTHTTNGNPSYANFSADVGRTAINDSTNPASFLQDGSPGGLNISDVSSPGDSITFTVNLSTIPSPANINAAALSPSQIRVSWKKNSDGNDVMLACGLSPVICFPDDGVVYPVGTILPGGGTILYSGADTVFSQSGLTTNTTYYYTAWAVTQDTKYSSAVSCKATTFCNTMNLLPFAESFDPASGTRSCWTQENSNPAWVFTAGNGTGPGYGYPSTSHSGTQNALLKDMSTADNINTLYSPVFDLSTYTDVNLTFWLYMRRWGTKQDLLKVYSRNNSDEAWTLLRSFPASIDEWTQEEIPVTSNSPAFQLAFEGNARNGFGVCLDDVELNGTSIYTLEVTPETLDVTPASGSVNFAVNSNTAWTALCDTSWCTVTPSGNGPGEIVAAYSENFSTGPRTANITVSVDGLLTKTVSLVQRGRGVSVGENQAQKTRIYPNPTKGIITIVPGGSSGKSVGISVLDITGRIILSRSIETGKEYRFDISGYPEGIYFVKVKGEDSVSVSRVILVR
jgi:M6 family metalloprotease-like protein